MNLFSQYKGLRREIYVIFWGRLVTNMGALIWPLLTLIMSNKLGMGAEKIASLLLIMSIIQLPTSLLGGKLADKYNKRNIIIVCDLVTVLCYLICGFIPISNTFIFLFFIGGLFASMEWPAYDALLADMSTTKDRERAYSLCYLGANIGLVLSPILGGILFENHLNIAFIISAVATLSSTILIYIFIKDVSRTIDDEKSSLEYESEKVGSSVFKVLSQNRTVLLYVLIGGISSLLYSQFNYLIPLNMDMLYGAKGAFYFGLITSTNAAVVILATPIFTYRFSRISDAKKMLIGEMFIVIGLSMYIFIQGILPLYFLSIIIFTFGEVFSTLGKNPYLTKRVPASHRGRMSSIAMIFATGFQAIAQKGVGALTDAFEITFVWKIVFIIGMISLMAFMWLLKCDKKEYPLLYSQKHKHENKSL